MGPDCVRFAARFVAARRRLCPELHVVAEAYNGVQALRLLDELRSSVVFVTAYDQHAVAAFVSGRSTAPR